MPIPSNPPFLPSPIGIGADVVEIPATTPSGSGLLSFLSGWPFLTGIPPKAGGIAPLREIFNAVNLLLSQHVFFQQSGGVYPWKGADGEDQPGLNYLKNAHVLGSDGKEYIAQKPSGPDIPASGGGFVGPVDPVGDTTGVWTGIEALYSVGVDPTYLKMVDKIISLSDALQTQLTEYEALRKLSIGCPKFWRSTTLPANHAYPDGSLILFDDWPEFKAVYDAGGFAGMLMPWDADAATQAANLGKYRPNSANPTGLYLPLHGGQFFRAWALGTGREAGAWGRDEIRNISGTLSQAVMVSPSASGAFTYTNIATNNFGGAGSPYPSRGTVNFSASNNVPTGPQNIPQHIWQPVIFYLGRPK